MTGLSELLRARTLGSLQRFPLALSTLVLLSILANLLTLTGSIFMLQVYDRVLTSRSVPTLVALTLLMTLLYGFFVLIESLRMRIAARLATLWAVGLARPLFATHVRQGLTGEEAMDPLRDLDLVQAFLGGAGVFVLLDLPWLPFYLALIYALHPLLGWLAIAGGLAITLILVISELQSRRSARQSNALLLERMAISDGARGNAEAVLAMGMLDAVAQRWAAVADPLARLQRQSADRMGLYNAASRGFRYFLQSAVLALGAYLAIQGQLTAGLMIAASIITARALAPIEQAVAHWRSFVTARQALHRIELALAAGPHAQSRTQLPRPSRQLVAINVATAPGPAQRPLASGIDFTLAAGDGLGIVGLSGSGKSSLARALVRVWPLVGGQIRLDGSELSHFEDARFGAFTGYLPQSVELFAGTIAQNISRFQPDDMNAAVLKAAQDCRVHELIAALPHGYDTHVGRHGAILSAGQRQRIGLARALFNDPFLIVLDEPNSNLDGEGDLALTAAILNARARGAIVVVVAHRPSAIAGVDKLLYMENGRQIRFGRKNDVLQAISGPPTRPADHLDYKDGQADADNADQP